MGRIGLAVALLVGFVASARADRWECTPDTIEVGKSTIKRGQLEYSGNEIEKDVGSTDNTPPAAPKNIEIYFDATRGNEKEPLDHERLTFKGTYDPDTAWIRLRTSDGYALVTTPDRTTVCSIGFHLQRNEHVSITAYDRAGNASEPFESDVTVPGGLVERHYRCGQIVVVWLAAFVLAGVLLLLLISLTFARKFGPTTAACEVMSPILGENVARAVARAYSFKFAAGMLATAALWTFDHPFIAILTCPFAISCLVERIVTQHIVRQFDHIRALGRHDNWIFINGRKLYAPRRVWEKASSLPTAGLVE